MAIKQPSGPQDLGHHSAACVVRSLPIGLLCTSRVFTTSTCWNSVWWTFGTEWSKVLLTY